jgi:GDSL-like Lipase/Acylhydrolase.
MRGLRQAVVAAACSGFLALLIGCGNAQAGWKSAPVLPRLDGATQKKLIATVGKGRRMGDRPDVFAKVGDSISQSPAFLQGLGCGRLEGLPALLRPSLRYFAERRLAGRSTDCTPVNSFSRNSAATRAYMPSGWALLPGGSADPTCGTDETPVACEIRAIRPAYAVILLGTNDVNFGNAIGVDPLDGYLARIRRIVKTARRSGVVPILNTIPPRLDSAAAEETTEALNAGLYRLAAARHVPLINLWRAFQPLPNRGLSTDGEHPSLYGGPDCTGLCDPNKCAPACDAGNLTPAGLRYGHNLRNLITLTTLWRLSRLAREGPIKRNPDA